MGTILVASSPLVSIWPGQPGNRVGFDSAPGYPGFRGDNGAGLTYVGLGVWPPPNGSQFSGPNWGSGSPTTPTVYKYLDFDSGPAGGVGSLTTGEFGITLDGTGSGSAISDTKFIGCRFQGNFLNGASQCVGANHGSGNIVFSYCSIVPRAIWSAGPANTAWPSQAWPAPPGGSWPSASVGTGKTAGSAGITPYMIPRNDSYEFCMNIGAGLGTFIIVDHCDLWGAGDSIQISNQQFAQITISDCWVHDHRFGFGPIWDNTLNYPNGYYVSFPTQGAGQFATNYQAKSAVPAGTATSNATFWDNSATNDHQDGIGEMSSSVGTNNVTIRHCTIASLGNTNGIAFQDAAAGSPYTHIAVINNYLTGYDTLVDLGGSYTAPDALNTNMTFTDNVIATDLKWSNQVLRFDLSPYFIAANNNLWRRNKILVYPGDTWSGGFISANGLYFLPNQTTSTMDWAL